MISRRKLFGFSAALVAAPAIVRVASLMPISVLKPAPNWFWDGQTMTATELRRLQWEAVKKWLEEMQQVVTLDVEYGPIRRSIVVEHGEDA